MFDRDNSGTINHNEIKWGLSDRNLRKSKQKVYFIATISAQSTTIKSSENYGTIFFKKKIIIYSATIYHDEIKWELSDKKVKSKQKVYFITIIPAKATTMRSSEDYLTKNIKS